MPRPVTPEIAVDIIIEMTDRPGRPIVLVERRHPPDGWAIPGGFVDVGETLLNAAIREAREETLLDVRPYHLLGNYSDPSRDDRGHTISAVFVAESAGEPVGADDAQYAQVYAPDACPLLAFDHSLIIEDYLAWLATGRVAPLTR